MTVTYTGEVATVRGFGCFLKLLFRWKGSIYKVVWPDLFLFLGLYYALNITYRVGLEEEQKRGIPKTDREIKKNDYYNPIILILIKLLFIVFESIAEYCETYSNLIPLSFVLGFYVSIVMTRWWDQYNYIPWPDPIAVYVSAYIHGQDERGRLMRRTIMRYCCLCLTMVFTMISPRVKKRFPTANHFVEAGLLLENEKAIIADLDEKFPGHPKHWLPIVWAASIVTRARKEGRIRDDFSVKTIIDELNKYRGNCGMLLNYDQISVPLVYTQVVTLAVYSFFGTCIMGRQWIDKPSTNGGSQRYKIDLYFPIFTMLQFFFYMGWLKVAESLINPFGEDDDDFEVNWLVDRNLQVSYLIVDEMHHEHPELIKDQYWDEVFPVQLPYTIATEPFREKHPQPSTANIEIPKAAAEIITSSYKDELGSTYDDNASGIHFFAGPKRSLSRTSHRERTLSTGSNQSSVVNLNMIGNSASRPGSVTNILKSLFTRTNSQPGSGDNQLGYQSQNMSASFGKLHPSQSSASLRNSLPTGPSRITDQVIEEVDEQLTITSGQRSSDDRVHMKDVFPQGDVCHSNSNPIDVPLLSLKDDKMSSISTSAPPQTASSIWSFSSSEKTASVPNSPKIINVSEKSVENDAFSVDSTVLIDNSEDSKLLKKRIEEDKKEWDALHWVHPKPQP